MQVHEGAEQPHAYDLPLLTGHSRKGRVTKAPLLGICTHLTTLLLSNLALPTVGMEGQNQEAGLLDMLRLCLKLVGSLFLKSMVKLLFTSVA